MREKIIANKETHEYPVIYGSLERERERETQREGGREGGSGEKRRERYIIPP